MSSNKLGAPVVAFRELVGELPWDLHDPEPGKRHDLPEYLRKSAHELEGQVYFQRAAEILREYGLFDTPWGDVYANDGVTIGDDTWVEIKGRLSAINVDEEIERFKNLPVIFTQPGCQQCLATERQFVRRGIPFNSVDVSKNVEAHKYVTQTLGFQSVPVVATGQGEVWSGYRPEKISALADAGTPAEHSLPEPSPVIIAQTSHIDLTSGQRLGGQTIVAERRM